MGKFGPQGGYGGIIDNDRGGYQSIWKRLDPKMYCWSHRFYVVKGHGRKACTAKKPVHKNESNHTNAMVGIQKDKE